MALPADGRMDLADTVTIGNAISALMGPELRNATWGMNLVYSETCPDSTNVIKFRKSGYVVAEGLAEGAVYIPSDANSDIVDTAVTVTATKVVVASPITYEAQRFGAGAANLPRVASAQARAIGRKFDDDVKALFPSVTAVASVSGNLDNDTLLLAVYRVHAGLTPPGAMVAVGDFKQINDLTRVAANSGAAQYANQTQIAILGATPAGNGFVANYLGVDLYQTSGLATTSSLYQGCVFNPQWAFAAAMGGAIGTEILKTGMGVASQVAGFSDVVMSHIFYGVALWHDTAACELRSAVAS
jgi:hypothetical protein